MVAAESLRPDRHFWITRVHSRCYHNSSLKLIHLGNEQWGRRKKCADCTWNGNWTRKSSGHITIMWNCWPAVDCHNGMSELCISSPFRQSGLLTLRRSKPNVRLQPAFSLCATTVYDFYFKIWRNNLGCVFLKFWLLSLSIMVTLCSVK